MVGDRQTCSLRVNFIVAWTKHLKAWFIGNKEKDLWKSFENVILCYSFSKQLNVTPYIEGQKFWFWNTSAEY